MPLVDRPGGLTILLTRRSDHLHDHAGQISFPGGRVDPGDADALATALRRDFDVQPLDGPAGLAPASGDTVRIGYIDAHFRQPFMLTLKDPAIADKALPDHAEPYRRLDTAVLEALILKGALEMTDEDIDHLNGLGYCPELLEHTFAELNRELRLWNA